MVDLSLRDESIQDRKVTIGRDLEGETDFEGGDIPPQHRTSWVQFGLGQVPTELEHVAAGPGNEMPGWGVGVAVILSTRAHPLPPVTLLIPEITGLICYNYLPPLSH